MTSPRPDLRTLARAWIDIGSQSFGGGSSTVYLMRRICVERFRWLTQRELTEDWALARFAPGIHLVALAGLVGQRLAGPRGVPIAVAGMMLPASIVTAVLTAGYDVVSGVPLVEQAFAGVTPITAGMAMGVAIQFALSVRQQGYRVLADAALMGTALGLAIADRASTVQIIIGSALIGALLFGRERSTTPPIPPAN